MNRFVVVGEFFEHERLQRRVGPTFEQIGGDDAEVLLPPTRSLSLAARHLKELPTGDRTPLPAGLDAARQVVESADSSLGIVVLVTDGRTVSLSALTAETVSAAVSQSAAKSE